MSILLGLVVNMSSFIVSFNNKRDFYEVPIALLETDCLFELYTDTYCPDLLYSTLKKSEYLKKIKHINTLLGRYDERLTSKKVVSVGIFNELYSKFKEAFGLRVDHPSRSSRTGYLACKRAIKKNKSLLFYSYCWEGVRGCLDSHEAKIDELVVFQVHPLVSSVKKTLKNRTELYRPEFEELIDDGLEREYIRFIKSYNIKVLCASEFVKKGLLEAGVPISKIFVCQYGLNNERMNLFDNKVINFDLNYGRPRSSLHKNKLKLVFCGSMIYRKGISYLIKAVESFPVDQLELTIITRNQPDANLRIESVEQVSVLTGLNDGEVLKVIANSDLFVMPSLCEGFGLVYAESLSVGTPVLCTANTGIVDLIDEGVHGFVVTPGNSEVLVELFNRLLMDKDKLNLMREHCISLSRSYKWSDFRCKLNVSLSHD